MAATLYQTLLSLLTPSTQLCKSTEDSWVEVSEQGNNEDDWVEVVNHGGMEDDPWVVPKEKLREEFAKAYENETRAQTATKLLASFDNTQVVSDEE